MRFSDLMEGLNPGGDTTEQSKKTTPTAERKHVSAKIETDKSEIGDHDGLVRLDVIFLAAPDKVPNRYFFIKKVDEAIHLLVCENHDCMKLA